jgi:predicted CopG family antitoxin
MSSPARRKEKEAAWEVEYAAREAERRRKEDLDIFDRINESDASEDVKDILHRMAAHVGLEA